MAGRSGTCAAAMPGVGIGLGGRLLEVMVLALLGHMWLMQVVPHVKVGSDGRVDGSGRMPSCDGEAAHGRRKGRLELGLTR